MRLSEFAAEVAVHDSLLLAINHDPGSGTLRLIVDFCRWMQQDYVESSQPEICQVYFEFTGVRSFNGRDEKIDHDTIYQAEFTDGMLVIDAQYDAEVPHNLDSYQLKIDADAVLIREVESGRILYG